jgi:hypothetical protein
MHTYRVDRWFWAGLLAAFTGCNNLSPLSDHNATITPSQLQVRGELFRRLHADGALQDELKVSLRDKAGKPVSNERIGIAVNGVRLKFYRGTTNYYVEYPYYQSPGDSLPVRGDTEYTFALILPDQTEHPIGSLRTQPDVTAGHFDPPASHGRQQDLVLHWRDLETRSYLVNLWKKWQDEGSRTDLHVNQVFESTDAWGNVVSAEGSPDPADYMDREDIGAGRGSLTIPAAYFRRGDRFANAIEVSFRSTEQRKAHASLLPGSYLRSERHVIRRINLVP